MKSIFQGVTLILFCFQWQPVYSQAPQRQMLYGGIVNPTSAATLAGSCEGVFSHFPIHANNLWNKERDEKYLRAADVSESLRRKLDGQASIYGRTNQYQDYISSMNNSMAILSGPSFNSSIAYQAYLYCGRVLKFFP